MRPDLPKRFTEKSKSPKKKFPRGNKNIAQKHVAPPKGMRRFRAAAGTTWDEEFYIGTDFGVMDRFLVANKGRPWNDVYSEICKQADLRSFNGHHFRSWLQYHVEQNCVLGDDGRVYDHRGTPICLYWKTFYVHPETGILEYVPKSKYRPHENDPPPRVFELGGKLYHKHDGLWYRVEMQEKESGRNGWTCDTFGIDDAFQAACSLTHNPWSAARNLRNKYGLSPKGKLWYCTKKQSANSREIQKIKKLCQTKEAA